MRNVLAPMPACIECERLRDVYSAATIRYLNFYSGSHPMSQETDQEGHQLQGEMRRPAGV